MCMTVHFRLIHGWRIGGVVHHFIKYEYEYIEYTVGVGTSSGSNHLRGSFPSFCGQFET